jgi:F0F1-type ATP synthase assembly protein I
MPDPSDRRETNVLALVFIVGGEMVVPVLIGLYLDRVTGWSPWLALVGAVIGFVGGTYHVLLIGRRLGGPRPPKSRGDAP